MSLPEATKDISNKPGKLGVTSPTVKADMQADVDRKIRLYGVIQAFRQNRYPDNAQIDETLTWVQDSSPVDESKLSVEGKKLISDVRDIIETARVIVKEKNADELFQNFMHHTTHTDAKLPSADTGVVDVSKDDIQKDGRQAVEHLRTLMRLFFTNSEARKLLSDASLIGRDLFARGAATVAEKARPDQETMARVDDAAPSAEWKGPNGEVSGVSDSVPQVVGEENKQKIKETANATVDQANQAKEEAVSDAKDVQSSAGVDSAGDLKDNEEKQEVAKQGLKAKLQGWKEKIPQQHRDNANEQYGKTVDFLKDEFPEERRDQFIYRLKKVLVECQQHQDYQEALTWFLSATETYFTHGRTLTSHHAGKAGDQVQDPSLTRAGTELRTLLERFANGQSIDPILDAFSQLSKDAQEDEGLRNWFKEVDSYIRKTLLEPGFVLSPQFDQNATKLRENGSDYINNKYKAHFDNVFNSTQAWFVAFGDDRLNKRFGEDWKRLTRDLLFDSEGSLSFKPRLWEDVRKVIVPTLAKHIGYIPIPRVEYTDNMLDLVIENITLEGTNILPNIISLDARNFVEFSPYDTIKDRNSHDFKFAFSQIQTDMRDVAFYFKKKSGFPKLQDSGLADIFLGGEGLTVKVHLTGAGKDQSSVFKVKDVTVKVDSLKFSIRDSKHDLLYKTIKPLATGLVKKQVAKAIEDAVRTGLEYLDEQLVAVRDRYAEARQDPNTSATGALAQLFEKKKDDAASKADSKAPKDAKFAIVSKRDSILVPNAGHEGGWINKVFERDNAAATGEGWKSDAFSIVPGSVKTAPVSAPTPGKHA